MKKKCNKVKLTKKEAQTFLNKVQSSHTRKYRREKRIYQCELCNGWHTTSQEEYADPTHTTIPVIEPDKWMKLMDNNTKIKTIQNVVARLPDGEIKVGTVFNGAGVSTFSDDGLWSYPEFTALLRVRKVTYKKPTPPTGRGGSKKNKI